MALQSPRNTPATRKKDAAAFTIRVAIPEDAISVQHIGSTVFTTTFGYSMPGEDLKTYLETAYSLKSVLEDIKSPLKTVIVACNPLNQIIGFVTLTEGTAEECIRSAPSPIELQRLYVDSTAQGQGVGGALMRFAEGNARSRGFRTCWLGVWEENYKAQKVYERAGYTKVGEHDFVMGEERQTDWILVKEL
jgi:ribosomal protein S18 acetylase RimI-like enzyme